jgi:Icc protein
MKIFTKLLFFTGLLAGCNAFEYSPNQTFDRNSPTGLNKTAIDKLMSVQTTNDTLKFILSGDTQRSYKEMPGFIEKVNSIDKVDFILVAGDITEFGSFQEMEGYADRMKKAEVPVITVIGNHDLTGRGKASYERMFGALNFSFVYKGIKFICHDTNSREYKYNGRVPDLGWLAKELKPSSGVNGYIAVAHVPALSDDFDQKLVPQYKTQFENTAGFVAALYGHTHTYLTSAPEDPFNYVVTGSIENKEFIVVTVINNKLTHERVFY